MFCTFHILLLPYKGFLVNFFANFMLRKEKKNKLETKETEKFLSIHAKSP